MVDNHKLRVAGIATIAVVVAVVVAALALGGSSSHHVTSGGAGRDVAGSGAGGTTTSSAKVARGVGSAALAPQAATNSAPSTAAPEFGSSSATGTAAGGSANAPLPAAAAVSDNVTATKVVKTGTLGLRVPRGQVQETITRVTALTSQSGGYVSQSRTDDELGSPTGELTLRIPAAGFDTAVTAAEKLGHVTSVTTNARDVTGRFVDLGARLTALQQTRATYLTILGGARTIGSTLEVQQHVDDVQQQIEELQGELKLLGNQSADGTLTVDVSQAGAVVVAPHHHHAPDGIGHAWHTSVHRFNRGFYSLVGALGPLLLVLLILAVLAAVGGLGYRGIRRATS